MTTDSNPPKSTHLFLLSHPGFGHVIPLTVFACKLLVAHRRIRPLDTLTVTIPVVGDLKAQADRQIQRCLQSGNESLKDNFHVVSLGGEGSVIGETYQALMQGFEPFYTAVHNVSPFKCATGREHTFTQRPNLYIVDFFMLHLLGNIRKLNEQDRKDEPTIPILTWNPGVIGPVMRCLGPEALGGVGDIEAKAKELAEKTGKTFDEAEREIDHPHKGDIIRVPGLPPMYDYEFFPQATNIPPEILKIQLMMHKFAYTMLLERDGMISASSAAFEPEASKATKEWYAGRNKSCFVVGPLVPNDMLIDNDTVAPSEVGQLDLSTTKEDEVKVFLDKIYNTSGKRSLLYASFGTLFWPPGDKVWTFIEIILSMNIPFLLVFDEVKFGKMPDHIVEKFKSSSDRAMTCNWTPQHFVLSHQVTGWFLTHAGQNSTSEAILKAVPMYFVSPDFLNARSAYSSFRIAYPLDAEQPGTAAHITLNLDIAYELMEVRTGLGLKPLHRGYQPKGTIEAIEEEIRSVIHDAFNGDGGIRKRKNIEALRDRVRNGVKDDGESGKDLLKFVEMYL